jgi:hypothetical protein
MNLLRLVVGGLVIFLVLTPCLGFAAGDGTLQLWNTHPRHAKTSHTDSSIWSWKTTPGILLLTSPPVVFGPAGPVAAPDVVVASLSASRPPFVPPRIEVFLPR